jgi:hypothetical protein
LYCTKFLVFKPSAYLDHGDQTVRCDICYAKIWKDEAARGLKSRVKSSYSICCSYGKVQLPRLKEPNEDYKKFFCVPDTKGKFFLKSIRRYNSMFSFTSMGGKVDSSVNKGRGPSMFRLRGQNYHSLGSLLPNDGSKPKFSQLYIYDTDNEVSNRQSIFRCVFYFSLYLIIIIYFPYDDM